VTQPSNSGWITATPSGVSSAGTSSISFTAGQTVSGLVVVRLPADGRVDFSASFGAAHVVADVVGYFDQDRSTEAGRFVPIWPARTFDSRRTGDPLLPSNGIAITWLDQYRTPITWVGGVVANVTVVGPTSGGWLAAFSADEPTTPFTSNITFASGETVANQVMSGASQRAVGTVPAGSVAVFNPYGSTPLILDVFGLYTSDLAPLPAVLATEARALSASVGPLQSATTPLR